VKQSSDDWATVEAEVARIIAESSEPFTAATVAQIKDFLTYIRGRTPVPMVAKGYWSTLNVWWDEPLQIEIFGDRFEVYKFRDRRTEIRAVYHVAGDPFPPDFDIDLPKA
jgi:hypothetical protein